MVMETTQKIQSLQKFLRILFGIIPIAAGLDKFTNILVNWEIYINPMILDILPIDGRTFMYIAGVIEIIAGITVLVNPRFGAYIVSGWLAVIALSLIMSGNYLDVAVRDIVMAAGAYTLGRLSELVYSENTDNKKVLWPAVNR
jgi:uncharacterized membrane protein YphA (DoxX/SURF4 family)